METSKALILLLCLMMADWSCGVIYYVKPEDGECPEIAVNSMCWSLLDYTINDISFDSTHSEFQFLEGEHHLPGTFHLEKIAVVSLVGNTSQNRLQVTIKCTKVASGIVFSYNVNVDIHGILIANCNAMSSLGKAALVFSSVSTVILRNVIVKCSTGLGVSFQSCNSLVLISNSSFEDNGGHNSYGGNVKFTFEHCDKSVLEIESSNFTNGLTSSPQASGLTVISFEPKLVITLQRIYITNNSGGNIDITSTSGLWNISLVDSLVVGGQTESGGGLSLKSTSIHPASFSCFCDRNDNNVLRIKSTTFRENFASSSAAGLAIVLQEACCFTEKINITRCRFESNANQGYGAAITVIKHHFPRIFMNKSPSTIAIFLSGTIFNHNVALRTESITEFVNIEKIVLTDCAFTSNKGSAISLKESNLVVSGQVIIENNTAENGAGLRFCSLSNMFINEDTILLLRNNKANNKGGAIQVQESCEYLHKPCFFQPVINTNLFKQFHELNMIIESDNNTADVAGESVYGGQIDNCFLYWTNWTSQNMFNTLFKFSETGNNQVSSDAYIVQFCDGSFTKTVTVYPGATIQVSLVTKGQLDGKAPSIVGVILPSNYSNLVELHEINDVRTSGTNCTDYSVIFSLKDENAEEIKAEFTIKQDNVRNKRNAILAIIFNRCPWGFDLINGSCQCSKFIEKRGFKCDINKLTIRKPILPHGSNELWCGCVNKSCHEQPIVYTNRCGYDGYCNPNVSVVLENSIDKQCNEGRTGIACGTCKENYSLVLGTNRCVKSCSNGYLGLIALYLFVGVLLTVLIMALNITVSKGYLYGLIFYANLVHVNQAIFFPSSFSNYDVPRIVIAWLNLDLGIEVCLYNGMTAVQKIWLQISFVLYLFALQIVIFILCRFYVRWTRLFGRNTTKVISTLILLIFTKVARLCYIIIASTLLHTSLEDSYVWQFSGDIRFGSSQHVPLLVMAMILGMFAFLISLCLLFIQFLLKISDIRCFKWVARLHPFFETFTGPCNSYFIFWPGLLFVLRIGLVVFYAFHHLQVLAMPATVAVCIFIATLSVVGPKGVYKQRPLNLLELSLILNIGVISIIASVYKHYFQNITRFSVYIAIASFITFQLATNFRKIRTAFGHLKKHCFSSVKKRTVHIDEHQKNVSHSELVINSESDEQSPVFAVRALPPIAQYNTFREPLIDSAKDD